MCFLQQINWLQHERPEEREASSNAKEAIPHGASGIAQSLEKSAWEVGASGAALMRGYPK
jgi:hypothetical protein